MKHVKTYENFNNIEPTNEWLGFSKKEKWEKLSNPSEYEVDEWFIKLFDPEKKHAIGIAGNKRIFDEIKRKLNRSEKIKFIEEALEGGKDYILVYDKGNKVKLRQLNYKGEFNPAGT